MELNTLLLLLLLLLVSIIEWQFSWKKFKQSLKKHWRLGKRYSRHLIILFLNRVFSLIPLKTNQVVFIAETHAELGNGNLAWIYKALPPSYRKILHLKANRTVKRSIKESLKLVYDISTSKYILLDDLARTLAYLHVRKGQEIVQLWHGPGAFKRFGFSRADLETKVHHGYKYYTKVAVSSETIRSCYAEAFNLPLDKIQATGFPRTDLFFDTEALRRSRVEILQKYPFLKNKKIILFAPTYRGDKIDKATYDFPLLETTKLYRALKKDHVFIFKWHPAIFSNHSNDVARETPLMLYPKFFYDLSAEPDINALMAVADIVITDYSSLIFDYVFLNKPLIYFVPDLPDYVTGRSFYFPFLDYVYGEITYDTEQLLSAIKRPKLCRVKRKAFKTKFLNACDGHSTERTYQWVFNDKLILPEKTAKKSRPAQNSRRTHA